MSELYYICIIYILLLLLYLLAKILISSNEGRQHLPSSFKGVRPQLPAAFAPPPLSGESQISSLPLPASCQCSHFSLHAEVHARHRQAAAEEEEARQTKDVEARPRGPGNPDNWPKLTPAVTRLHQQVSCIKSGSPLPVSRTSLAFLQVFFARQGQKKKKKNRDSERSGCPVTRGCAALAAALPDCRPSPGPGTKGLAAHSTPRMLTRGEPTSLPPPPASFRGNREQKLTNKEEEEEGDRSTQQNSFSDFCIVA